MKSMPNNSLLRKPTGIVWVGILAIIVAFLGWRIVILGMSEYYVAEGFGDKALAWHASHPVALTLEASKLLESNPAHAENLLRQAIGKKPGDGSSWMLLALLYEKRGDTTLAIRAATRANELSPMHSGVQLELGKFWLRQERIDTAIKSLDRTIRVRPQLATDIFPLFLLLAENPQTRPMFTTVIADNPAWWKSFYRHLAANATHLDTVRDIYQMQQKSKIAITSGERRSLLARLQKEGYWLESYFTWLNNLPKEQLGNLGNVFNGSFEHGISNEGFDWIAPKTNGAIVEDAPTYGTTGSKALNVSFSGQKIRFQHLYQYLMLDPGKYFLRGRARIDSLRTEKGLQWVVRCAQGPTEYIAGKSGFFVGSDQWRHFSTGIEIPEDCPVQILRLELGGQAALDFVAEGSAWFDDLEIEKRVD